MRLLLDTHTFIWMDTNSSRLSPVVRSLIADPGSEVLLSTATVWGMAIKLQLGKLRLRVHLNEMVLCQQQASGIQLLPVNLEHAITVETLPLHHRDPFDRLLVAQAMAEHAALLSCDAVLDRYPITRVW